MTDNLSKKQKLIQNGIFAVLMILAAVFLFWKCRYGFANKDESLYLVIPYRLWQGDGLFVNEWNLSAFSSFLLMPFMYIYMAIVGTTEGILLNFRYIFTAVQGLCAVFIYFKLKKYNWFGAVAAALTFFIYAPFGIMALSYNSMGIQCVAVAMVLLLTNENGKKLPYIIAGVLFAAAVLCCPFLVAVYAFYSVLVLINTVKSGCFDLDILDKKCWIWVTVGISALAVVFLAFVLSRASIGEIITGLQWMLNDPQHESKGILTVVAGYFKGVFLCNEWSLFVYAGYLALLVTRFLTKGKKIPDALFFCAGAMLSAIMMAPFVTWEMYINRVIFPVNIFALYCVVLSESGIVKRLFKILWLPGIMYGICIHMASTEGFLNIASVSLISLVGSLVIVAITATEIFEKTSNGFLNILSLCAVTAVLCMQIGATTYTRYESVFWESGWFGAGMPAQTQTLTKGPEKGILATETKEEMYGAFVEDVETLVEEHNPESILYISQNTWLYLISEDVRMASFSAWLPGVNEEEMKHTMERLESYFDIDQSRLPQVIYAENVYSQLADEFASKLGYTGYETANGNFVYTR